MIFLCVTYSKDHILLSDFAAKCSKPNSDLCVSLHDLPGMENDLRSPRVKPSRKVCGCLKNPSPSYQPMKRTRFMLFQLFLSGSRNLF